MEGGGWGDAARLQGERGSCPVSVASPMAPCSSPCTVYNHPWFLTLAFFTVPHIPLFLSLSCLLSRETDPSLPQIICHNAVLCAHCRHCPCSLPSGCEYCQRLGTGTGAQAPVLRQQQSLPMVFSSSLFIMELCKNSLYSKPWSQLLCRVECRGLFCLHWVSTQKFVFLFSHGWLWGC